jgi:hypothetical protein
MASGRRIGDAGVHIVGKIVSRDLGWIFRDQPVADYGIDAHIEVVDDAGQPTGRLLALQIKTGSSYARDRFSSANLRHLTYWLEHSLPVLVVIVDEDTETAYWRVVSEPIERTESGWSIEVSQENVLGASAKEPLAALASERLRDGIDQAPTPYEVERKAVEAFDRIAVGALDTDGDAGGLAFEGVLSRHGVSVVRKYVFRGMQFVIKRTIAAYCDVRALESLAGLDIRASQYGSWSWIVCPLAVRVAGEFVFELQPFVDGMPFDQLVARNRYPFAGQFVGKLYVTLISALNKLHKAGIVHRDVRPENLILVPSGDVVLLDSTFATRIGGTQVPVANASFSPPEQTAGKAEAVSDYYSVAATIFYLCHGEVPSGLPPDDVETDIGNYWMRDAPFSRLLDPDPRRRPQTVWDALWKDHSGVALWELTGVLDAGELGYLVLGKSHTALVDEDRLKAILGEALVWTSNVELRRDVQRARADPSVWLRG